MSETNKALVRRYYATALGDLAAMGEVVTEQFVDHHFPPGLPPGPDGARRFFRDILGSVFSEMRIEYEEMIAEEDKVVCQFALHAKHTGEFAGIAARGKEIRCPAISIFRVADGKLAEAWEIADVAGLLEQMKSV
ncbi:MAG TPA: ester cyclase [Candidatus Brocadiia bacterium]|nr:ester cyclase [Candidatus Brocadiia bacterium]